MANDDSQLYLQLDELGQLSVDERYSSTFFETDLSEADRATVWSRRLFKTKNPFAAAPQSKLTCVKWAEVFGGKICIGHKYEWRYMYTTGTLLITLSEPEDIKNEVEDCLRDSASIAAVSAIIAAFGTGGIALSSAISFFRAPRKIALILARRYARRDDAALGI